MSQLRKSPLRGKLKEVTSQLSNKDNEMNTLDNCGETPLHIACEHGHLDIVRVLVIRQECDLNIPDSFSNTPLHMACNHNYIVELLIADQRCNLNIQL